MCLRPHRIGETLADADFSVQRDEFIGLLEGYVEFRIVDYQHELGIIDRRFAPPGLAAAPGGAIVYWHVDDVAATLDRLVSLGAKQLQGITERGPGFVTASVVDPFGNVLVSCTTAITSTSAATAEKRTRRPSPTVGVTHVEKA